MSPYINVDNVNISYCVVRENVYFNTDCNNWIIRNNVLQGIFNSNVTGSSNLLVENNIIQGQGSINGFSNSINVIIQNNIFISNANTNSIVFGGSANNLIVANNIFYNTRPYTPLNSTITNVSFSNNISYRQGAPNPFPPNGVDGNTVTGSFVDTDPLFENYDGTLFNFAHNYRLKSNSVGHNAGLDGTDIGVYGRGNIFSMTGEPNIPSVRTFSILNPITTSGGTINITVTASKARVD